jgi:hypothetical protein
LGLLRVVDDRILGLLLAPTVGLSITLLTVFLVNRFGVSLGAAGRPAGLPTFPQHRSYYDDGVDPGEPNLIYTLDVTHTFALLRCLLPAQRWVQPNLLSQDVPHACEVVGGPRRSLLRL